MPDAETRGVTILMADDDEEEDRDFTRGEEDVFRAYELGASSFITKPVTFSGLVEAMRTWRQYWCETVELPGH